MLFLERVSSCKGVNAPRLRLHPRFDDELLEIRVGCFSVTLGPDIRVEGSGGGRGTNPPIFGEEEEGEEGGARRWFASDVEGGGGSRCCAPHVKGEGGCRR